MEGLPIQCNLNKLELAERRRTVLSTIRNLLPRITPIASGYRYEFHWSPSVWDDLQDVVQFERRCCPFLEFSLSRQEASETIRLEITGPQGAKALIEDFFGKDTPDSLPG